MTALTLPPIEALDQAAAELVAETNDGARKRAIDKAIYEMHAGLRIVATTGGFLVPSFREAGVIYRVSNVHGCSCKAGERGKPCKHALAIEVVQRAQMYTMPVITPRSQAYEEALAELMECF